jgi:hypothetical protein
VSVATSAEVADVSPPREPQTSGFTAQRPTKASDANAGAITQDNIAALIAQPTSRKHFIAILSPWVWQSI